MGRAGAPQNRGADTRQRSKAESIIFIGTKVSKRNVEFHFSSGGVRTLTIESTAVRASGGKSR
jgi:hypothetical protein